MIDTNLLAKISADDQAFKQRIATKVWERANTFAAQFKISVQTGNWNSCYYQLLEFYKTITPYAKLSYLNEVQKQIETISYSDDVQLKRRTCLKVMKRLAQQMSLLQQYRSQHIKQNAL